MVMKTRVCNGKVDQIDKVHVKDPDQYRGITYMGQVRRSRLTFEGTDGKVHRKSYWRSVRELPLYVGWYEIQFAADPKMVRLRWWSGKSWYQNPKGVLTYFGDHPRDKWRGVTV